MTPTPRVLLLPGWQNSGASHWQSHWEALHAFERVQQADWDWPRRGDWMARLEDVVLADPRPVVLVAHSLGCHLVAAWAALSSRVAQVRGALLVAPPDLERDDMPPQVTTWRPIVRDRLPFAATLLYGDDDPYAGVDRTLELAASWGAAATSLGRVAHVNGDSGLAEWPAGLAWLDRLRGG